MSSPIFICCWNFSCNLNFYAHFVAFNQWVHWKIKKILSSARKSRHQLLKRLWWKNSLLCATTVAQQYNKTAKRELGSTISTISQLSLSRRFIETCFSRTQKKKILWHVKKSIFLKNSSSRMCVIYFL